MKFCIPFLLLFAMLTTYTGLAQDSLAVRVSDSVPRPAKKSFFRFFGRNTEKAQQGKLLVTPFLLPGYSPDIKLSLAGGTIFSFRTNRHDTLLPRSSIALTLTYSSIKAFVASSGWNTFWLHDHLRVYAFIQYRSSRDAYYGVGYENAIHTHFPDSTNFWRSFFIAQVRPLWKVKKHFFAGLNLDMNQNILWKVNAHMSKDPNYLRHGSHIVNTGVGGMVSYDSRDFPQNAYRGIYATAIYTFYQKALGGNTNFRVLDVDGRYYLPLSKNKVRTLAFNWRSRYDFGDVPFTSMISLGTSLDLRGLRFGQFRDRYLNYFITEYRHQLYWRNKPTRFGFAVWSGVGAVGGSFSKALFKYPLPDVGIGLRFEIQPRLNARIDLGYGPGPSGNRTGTYVNFLEAY